MKKKYIIITILFGLLAFACKEVIEQQIEENSDTGIGNSLRVVQVTKAEQISVSSEIYAIGRLASKQESKLSFKTGGMIKQINVREGQNVSVGTVLATLDMEEINAQVQQALVGNTQAEITLKNAELQVEKYQRDYETVKSLYEDRVTTLTELKDTKSLLDNARNQVEAAMTGLSFSKENQKIANYNQRLSKITAPTSGIILKQLAEPSEIIGPGTPVFLFGSKNDALVLKASITDKDIVRIKMGNQARVKFDAHPGQMFEGRIIEIAGIADPFTGTYEIEIELNRTAKKLLSGFIGEALIQSDDKVQLISVPIDAMIRGNGNTILVYTVKNGKVEAKTVQVGPIEGRDLVVYDGLEIEDLVIVKGANYVAPNDSVKVEMQ